MLDTTGLSLGTDEERVAFLREHAEAVYREVTDDLRRPVRDEELVYAAADLVPGLVPTREQMAAERELALPDKTGIELAQGLFFSFVLASPRCGAHLVWSMLRPTDEALERLDDFRATGVADLGGTYLERRGRVGYIEIRNDAYSERGGLAHAADDRGRGRPGAARPRGGDRRDPRRDRLAPALCGAAGVRRGREPDAPLRGPGGLHVLRHARPGLREQALPRAVVAGVAAGRAGGDDREAVDRRSRDVRDRRRVPAPAHGRPRDRRARCAAVPAGAEGGDPAGRLQSAAAAVGRRPDREAGDSLRARVRRGNAQRRPVDRRAGGGGRDGRRGRGSGSCSDRLRPGQRRGEPPRPAGRRRAAGDLPRVHGDVLPRAGVLPPEPGARPESRAALAETRDLGSRRAAPARGATGAAALAAARDLRRRCRVAGRCA